MQIGRRQYERGVREQSQWTEDNLIDFDKRELLDQAMISVNRNAIENFFFEIF